MKASRTPQNFVKLSVRDYALKRGEFTTDEMVEFTGCKRSSVQTEIRRMMDEGLLTSGPATRRRSGPGQPQSVYKLVTDLDKVTILAEQVRSFLPSAVQSDRPDSRTFSTARRLLDIVATSKQTEAERNAYLAEARDLLAAAWAEEGGSKTPKDGVLQYEQGRLQFLKGDYEGAKGLFASAANLIGQAEAFSAERSKIEEHNLAIGIREAISEIRDDGIGRLLEAMKGIINKPARPEYPFRSAVTDALEVIVGNSRVPRAGVVVLDSLKPRVDSGLRDRVVKRVWKYASLRRTEDYRSAGYLSRNKRYSGRYVVRGVNPFLSIGENLSEVGQNQVEELELSLAVRGPTEILPTPPRPIARILTYVKTR